MTSRAFVANCDFRESGDKGVSVGERTSVAIEDSKFESCRIGVEVKDESRVVMSRCSIPESEIRVNTLDFEVPAQNQFFLPPDVCILEVKADERIPIWLTSVLARHQCDLSRVSKYCLGLRRGFESFRDRSLMASGPLRRVATKASRA